MRRVRLALLLILSALVVIVGCAKYKLPSSEDPKYITIPPLDADRSGTIDDKDVQMLEAHQTGAGFSEVLKAGLTCRTAWLCLILKEGGNGYGWRNSKP